MRGLRASAAAGTVVAAVVTAGLFAASDGQRASVVFLVSTRLSDGRLQPIAPAASRLRTYAQIVSTPAARALVARQAGMRPENLTVRAASPEGTDTIEVTVTADEAPVALRAADQVVSVASRLVDVAEGETSGGSAGLVRLRVVDRTAGPELDAITVVRAVLRGAVAGVLFGCLVLALVVRWRRGEKSPAGSEVVAAPTADPGVAAAGAPAVADVVPPPSILDDLEALMTLYDEPIEAADDPPPDDVPSPSLSTHWSHDDDAGRQ